MAMAAEVVSMGQAVAEYEGWAQNFQLSKTNP